ncbi:MAG: phage major tail tube protein [Proteobacteria bacterium]|nr:MAG: phage major tail tube protein [Pseudomonadota bacterium]
MLPKIFKDFTAYADGYGYIGKVPELTPPKITKKMNEYKAGGMAGTTKVFMGEVEEMTADMTLEEYSPEMLKLWGFTNGKDAAMTFRGAMQGGGETWPVIISMRGEYSEMDPGSWKKGDDAKLKVTMVVNYLKITINGEEITEIDVNNGILIVDGNDLRAEINTALGV